MKVLRHLLPSEDLIYLGDTARVPYGTRSSETITRFALQDAQFLLRQDVKLIVVACGTASSIAIDELRRQSPVPVIGIVEPVAQAAIQATQNHRIAILGTNATIRSRAIEREIRHLDPAAQVHGLPCPLLVPLIENGYLDPSNAILRMVLHEYLSNIINYKPDVVILGCTHYPLVSAAIQQYISARLIDSGQAVAQVTHQTLCERSLCNDKVHKGKSIYYVTDTVANFTGIAELFLGEPTDGQIRQVELG